MKALLISTVLLLTACSITSRKDIKQNKLAFGSNISELELEPGAQLADEDSISVYGADFESEDGSPADNADIMSEILAEDADYIPPTAVEQAEHGKIDLPINKYVKVWINYFTGRGREHMTRYLSRSSKYIPKMKEILVNEGLPSDLVYLPVIESGFYTRAKSFKGATGYWQFMPGSARDYGLTVNHLVDERKDYVRSTEAAAKYLKKLYLMFDDWNLALSAYNAGPNRVKRQLKNAGTKNYWKLVKNKKLYKETREYVPKFIAATLIAKSPLNYGFIDVPYQEVQNYQSLYVGRPISLRSLAKNTGVPFREIKKLNPRYRSHQVPIYKGDTSLVRVPTGNLAQAQLVVPLSFTTISKRVYKPLKITKYRVKRGDNLTRIARKFGVTVSSLRRNNSIGRRSILYVGKKIKIINPKKRIRTSSAVKSVTAKASRNYRKIKKVHTVRRGENLSLIAKRYKVPLGRLLKFNKMGLNKKIHAGQKIKLTASLSPALKNRKPRMVTYRVKRGDNLQKISKKFGTSVSKLKATNNLRSSRINAEQKLKIAADNIKMHIVKRGDSLIAIASKYKVSLSNILRANDLKNKSKIRVGRALRIPIARR